MLIFIVVLLTVCVLQINDDDDDDTGDDDVLSLSVPILRQSLNLIIFFSAFIV